MLSWYQIYIYGKCPQVGLNDRTVFTFSNNHVEPRAERVQCHSNIRNLLHHPAAAAPDRTQDTMFSPVGCKKSCCWVRPGGRGWSSSPCPFSLQLAEHFTARSPQECSRLGFLRDIRFYCSADAISVPPCLAAMQRGNKCFRYPQERDLVGGSWRRRVTQTDQQETEQQRSRRRGEGERHSSWDNTDR